MTKLTVEKSREALVESVFSGSEDLIAECCKTVGPDDKEDLMDETVEAELGDLLEEIICHDPDNATEFKHLVDAVKKARRIRLQQARKEKTKYKRAAAKAKRMVAILKRNFRKPQAKSKATAKASPTAPSAEQSMDGGGAGIDDDAGDRKEAIAEPSPAVPAAAQHSDAAAPAAMPSARAPSVRVYSTPDLLKTLIPPRWQAVARHPGVSLACQNG